MRPSQYSSTLRCSKSSSPISLQRTIGSSSKSWCQRTRWYRTWRIMASNQRAGAPRITRGASRERARGGVWHVAHTLADVPAMPERIVGCPVKGSPDGAREWLTDLGACRDRLRGEHADLGELVSKMHEAVA